MRPPRKHVHLNDRRAQIAFNEQIREYKGLAPRSYKKKSWSNKSICSKIEYQLSRADIQRNEATKSALESLVAANLAPQRKVRAFKRIMAAFYKEQLAEFLERFMRKQYEG